MTALGLLCPAHSAQDDYPRIEQLLGGDIRVDVVRADIGAEALRETGGDARLAAGMEQLRLAGAEAVVWASTGGTAVTGWEDAHEQVRALARAAGMPASSTSFAFVHAARELGARRVAVGTTYPQDVAERFAGFLRAGGLEVTGVHGAAAGTAAGGEAELIALAREADRADAEAVLLPDTSLPTAAHLPALEKDLGKPVLAAGQVTAWEALRLADRRVNAPSLGTLFTREPLVQA
ncbi:MAG TPA: decarboxylase [Streptomyces sp.]|nr:decarboxylase [Streptomyces sp.]